MSDRHNGPPESGHGGVLAGRLAGLLEPTAGVARFHSPIPLGSPLEIERAEHAVTVAGHEGRVATVRRLERRLDVDPFERVDDHEVAAAEAAWLDGWQWLHPSPTCFGCGPARRSDGLGLTPGRIPGRADHVSSLDATGHLPPSARDAEMPAWLIWAALDCVGAGPALAAVTPGVAVVTGELAVEVRRPVPTGDALVAHSRLAGRSGRRLFVESALADRTGAVFAVSTAVWFAEEVTVP